MWNEILNLTIIAYRGYKPIKKNDPIPIDFILLSDNKSYIELNEQDPYQYQDYNRSARTINIKQDPKTWQDLYEMQGYYQESTDFYID